MRVFAVHILSAGVSLDFRSRLLRTLRAVEPILGVPGVLVVGSEVPNLLEPDARSSLVVSQDVDIAVPVARHADVKARLPQLHGLSPSREEPSVWLPAGDDMIEVNFIGMDPDSDRSGETYVLEDRELPLLVFRYLGLLRPGPPVTVEGIAVPVPRPAGLLLEKLVTDRSGEKGDRDLLVALGLLLVCTAPDLQELHGSYRTLSDEERHVVTSALSTLSLIGPLADMPDPIPHRQRIAALMTRLEDKEQ